jgi:hypothetical protein
LLETALIVCLAGIVLAVFLPAFFRAMRTSKVAEASGELARMHRATAAYYGARHGPRRSESTHCLPAAAGPTPAAPSVDPVGVDFAAETTPGASTWAALGYAPEDAIRYRYTFAPVKDGCDLGATPGRSLVVLRAEGDLDGDGKLSLFEREITVNDAGELVPRGILRVQDRVE